MPTCLWRACSRDARFRIDLCAVHGGARLPGAPLDLSRHVAIMAIVNRTPDSFYDRGATFALDPT